LPLITAFYFVDNVTLSCFSFTAFIFTIGNRRKNFSTILLIFYDMTSRVDFLKFYIINITALLWFTATETCFLNCHNLYMCLFLPKHFLPTSFPEITYLITPIHYNIFILLALNCLFKLASKTLNTSL